MELPELLVADAGHWRQWLVDNHATSSGVVVVLAKKGVVAPTSLSYAEACVIRAISYTHFGPFRTAVSEFSYTPTQGHLTSA